MKKLYLLGIIILFLSASGAGYTTYAQNDYAFDPNKNYTPQLVTGYKISQDTVELKITKKKIGKKIQHVAMVSYQSECQKGTLKNMDFKEYSQFFPDTYKKMYEAMDASQTILVVFKDTKCSKNKKKKYTTSLLLPKNKNDIVMVNFIHMNSDDSMISHSETYDNLNK